MPLLATGLVFSMFITIAWSPILADFGGDSATYWLMANYYSPFGEDMIPAAHFANTSRYPPLYPLLLAISGGGNSILVAHLVTVTCLLISLIVIYRFYRDNDLSVAETLCLIGLFCMLRITRLESLQLHSEHLYLLASMLALWAAERARDTPSRSIQFVLIGAAVAAFFTRSIGITLVAALVFYSAGARGRHLVKPAVIIVSVLALVKFASGNSASYIHDLVSEYMTTGLAYRVYESATMLPYLWVWTFAVPFDVTYSKIFFGAAAVLFMTGLAYRVIRKRVDGYYAAAYLLVVLVWPHPEETARLLYPIIPLLLLYANLAVRNLIARFHGNGARPLIWFFPSLLAVFVVPDVFVFAQRIATPVDDSYAVYKRTLAWHEPDERKVAMNVGYLRALDTAYASITETVAPDECVLAIKASVVAAATNRLALPFPSIHATPDAFARAIENGGCPYALMVREPSPSYPEEFYPAKRLASAARSLRSFGNPLIPGRLEAQLVRLGEHAGPARAE